MGDKENANSIDFFTLASLWLAIYSILNATVAGGLTGAVIAALIGFAAATALPAGPEGIRALPLALSSLLFVCGFIILVIHFTFGR